MAHPETVYLQIRAGATRTVSLDMQDDLDKVVDGVGAAETFTGTPTVTPDIATGITLSNKVVNTAAMWVKGRSVAIGKGIQFSVAVASSVAVGMIYTITVTCSTTGVSPTETIPYAVELTVV